MADKKTEKLLSDIEKLELQEKQLAERKKQLKAKLNTEQRKQDTHMKVVVGAHIISMFEPFDMSNEKTDKDAFYSDLNNYVKRFVESQKQETQKSENGYERFGRAISQKLKEIFERDLTSEELDAFVNEYIPSSSKYIYRRCNKSQNNQ